MSDIDERRVVRCPFHEASSYLGAFIAEHQAGDDGTVRIALHLPIGMFADRRPLIERRLVATLYPLPWISDLYPTYSVTWSAKTDVSLPEFAGALAVENCRRHHCFQLIVSGRCGSPLKAVGTTRDATFGRRLTLGSARDLLRSIAEHVENASAHDEAARAGYSPLTHFTRDWSDSGRMWELSGMVDPRRAPVLVTRD
jgi:hypothetical protein